MLNTQQLYAHYLEHPHIQTDTRKIKKGDFFFALKGKHFNGNAYAQEALNKGAPFAVIDEQAYLTDKRMLLVPNVLEALQQLAAFHRQQFDIPFIAITGSNGKTTTKELSHAVLDSTFTTYATEGNLNNHIGIPLTLLRIKKGTEMVIVEMGANHQKEIEGYCKIVKPTHGLITNIGKAHLEGFGGIEGVKKGKGELFDFLRANQGIAFSCADFSYFKEMTQGLSKVNWYGSSESLFVNGKVISKHPLLKVSLNYGGKIATQLSGEYNLYNILAAATLGKYFGVEEKKIHDAIVHYHPENARSQVLRKGSNTFILDAYNANPTSMRAAIEDFIERTNSNKYLFLGAMMELGDDSIKEHQHLVDFIKKHPFQKVILVGGDFKEVSHPFLYFPNIKKAKEWFEQQEYEDALFLIKGSRSIEMERILE